MKKINDKSWIAAILAAIFSFLFIIASVFLSNWFQTFYNINEKIIQSILKCKVFDLQWIVKFYNFVASKFNEMFDYLKLKELDAPSSLTPTIVFIWLILEEIGIKKITILKYTTSSLYRPLLKQQHNKIYLKPLFWILKFANFASTLVFCIGWHYSDTAFQLCGFFGLVTLYAFGYMYKHSYEKFIRKTHKAKGCTSNVVEEKN